MNLRRREFSIGSMVSCLALATSGICRAHAAISSDTRLIPSTGEAIPAVGLGSWITFNVGSDPVLRDESADVIDAFLGAGGGMIDSSPMYGSSQAVIGYGLRKIGNTNGLFSADKVWTDARNGKDQIAQTQDAWGVHRFDLLQVHNLVDWAAHLPMLFDMKSAGQIRYVGITTSHGRRHADLERIMRDHPLDFVQLTYNAADRDTERRLLPLAQDRGIGVIANRPFRRGQLPERLRGRPLPDWATQVGASSWAQLLLGFVLDHPAVTVAIPATTRVDHLLENKASAHGQRWDADTRRRMIEIADSL